MNDSQMFPDSSSKAPTNHGSGVSRRTIVSTAAWSIPVISYAVTAPLASASLVEPENPLAEALGYSNVIAEVPSEFRFDYYMDVPTGVRPTGMTYRYRPTHLGDTATLGSGALMTNIRASIDQNWGIVATQTISANYERIFVHLRGDANVSYGSSNVRETGDWQPRFTWPGGAPATQLSLPAYDPTLTTSPAGGRPVGISTWDRRTDPDYTSGNQQSGWAVPSTTGVVRYSQFVMATGSRRLVSTGGDLSPQAYYQFRNPATGTTWTHAGTNTAPQLINVGGGASARGNTSSTRNIESGALGMTGDRGGPRLNAALGLPSTATFTLPERGYWALEVWPQAASSTAAPVPAGVSWDPATEPGHQIGSIFNFPASSGVILNPAVTEIAP